MKPLRRPSLLFVPPLDERFWLSARKRAAELGGLLIDLEDAVHPRSKERAREAIGIRAADLGAMRSENPGLQVHVRVNNCRSAHWTEDARLVKELLDGKAIDGVMYPKVESPRELELVRATLGSAPLIATIETLRGYSAHREILRREFEIDLCAVGAEDLCADIGIDRPPVYYDNPLLSRIAVDIALGALSCGAAFLGNIWPYLEATELFPSFVAEVMLDCALKARGKVCFHPYQLPVVNALMDETRTQLLRARNLTGRLEAIEQRWRATGLTAATFNGRMVDLPEALRVRRFLAEAQSDEAKSLLEIALARLELSQPDSE